MRSINPTESVRARFLVFLLANSIKLTVLLVVVLYLDCNFDYLIILIRNFSSWILIRILHFIFGLLNRTIFFIRSISSTKIFLRIWCVYGPINFYSRWQWNLISFWNIIPDIIVITNNMLSICFNILYLVLFLIFEIAWAVWNRFLFWKLNISLQQWFGTCTNLQFFVLPKLFLYYRCFPRKEWLTLICLCQHVLILFLLIVKLSLMFWGKKPLLRLTFSLAQIVKFDLLITISNVIFVLSCGNLTKHANWIPSIL